MTIYVDMMFALNTVINYLLLRGSAAMGGVPATMRRLILAAALGGAYAVAAVLPGLHWLQGTAFQLLCAAGMLLTAFGWKRITVKQGLFFLALSFALSGAVMLAVQVLEPDCVLLGGRIYYGVTTPALLLVAGLCYGLAAVVLNGWGTHTGGDLVSLTLELDGRRVDLRALRDTGNTLRDPLTGQRVLVAGWKVLAQLLPEAKLDQSHFHDPSVLVTRLADQYPALRVRLIAYTAVGTSHGLLPVVLCRAAVRKKWVQVPVAFSPAELSANGHFQALMGGTIL